MLATMLRSTSSSLKIKVAERLAHVPEGPRRSVRLLAHDKIPEVAVPVLTHRVITTFAAQAEGLDAKQIIGRLISETLEQK